MVTSSGEDMTGFENSSSKVKPLGVDVGRSGSSSSKDKTPGVNVGESEVVCVRIV